MKESQNATELQHMVSYIQKNNVCSILEIGSRYGETLARMARATPLGSMVISVEWPGMQTGRSNSLPKLLDTIQGLCDEGYDARVILGDSKDRIVYSRVKDLAPFDFVFIDGDHSYVGALTDWEKYGPLGKHVGFHDIESALWEIPKVWKNIKNISHTKKRIVEYVSDPEPNHHRMGIGIIDQGGLE